MIAYKVVNKRNRSLVMDVLCCEVEDPYNKYSIEYPMGKTISIPKYTVGTFLCTSLEEAIDWKDKFFYLEPKILKVEILDKPYKPKKICSEIRNKDIDAFYKEKKFSEKFNFLNIVCSHKIKVLEEVKDNE